MDTKRTQKRRWTATSLATLPVGTHTDPGCAGLQLRVRTKRDGSTSRRWLLRLKFGGEETRLALGAFPAVSLEEARRLSRELRADAERGIDPRRAGPRRRSRPAALPLSAASAGDQHSIRFLVSEYLTFHVERRHKRPEYVSGLLRRDVLPQWGDRDARSIRPREVVELLDAIVARGSPAAANRTAATLAQLFKFGIHRAIVEQSPVQLLYRPGGREKPRERVLSDDELRTFLRDPLKCTRFERLAHVMTILLLTAQRRGELALARWEHIDWNARTWAIPAENSKTGRAHVVPLSGWAAREFEALHRLAGGSAFVMPNSRGDGPIDPKQLTRGLAKCRRRFARVGIAPFTLHDLRRTCRTGLGRLGIAPHVAEKVLNHAAADRIVATYDRANYFDEQRAALDAWARHLEALRDGSPA